MFSIFAAATTEHAVKRAKYALPYQETKKICVKNQYVRNEIIQN